MPFGSGKQNPSTRRTKKTTQKAKWNKISREISKPLLVLRLTRGGKDVGSGYGLFAPGTWPRPLLPDGRTSANPRKVAIYEGHLVTGFAGGFASAKDPNTSDTHSAPAGNFGLADGKNIRDLVIKKLNGQSQVNIIGSTKSNLAPESTSDFPHIMGYARGPTQQQFWY